MTRHICCVTVTYGNRLELLKQCIESAKGAGFDHCHVVLNGAHESTCSWVRDKSREDGFVSYSTSAANLGSAGGFGMALQFTSRCDFQRYILLDDDNLIPRESVSILLQSLDRCIGGASGMREDNVAIVGYRTTHQRHESSTAPDELLSRSTAFLGFQFSKILTKIKARLPGKDRLPRATAQGKDVILTDLISVRACAWSGMCFSGELALCYGTTLSELFLYGDDIEYTRRVTRSGGHIFLNRSAVVCELDASWATVAQGSNSFTTLLSGFRTAPLRASYMVRNQTYIDFNLESGNILFTLFNCLIYSALMIAFAALTFRPREAWLYIRSVHSGIRGRLGQIKEVDL